MIRNPHHLITGTGEYHASVSRRLAIGSGNSPYHIVVDDCIHGAATAGRYPYVWLTAELVSAKLHRLSDLPKNVKGLVWASVAMKWLRSAMMGKIMLLASVRLSMIQEGTMPCIHACFLRYLIMVASKAHHESVCLFMISV